MVCQTFIGFNDDLHAAKNLSNVIGKYFFSEQFKTVLIRLNNGSDINLAMAKNLTLVLSLHMLIIIVIVILI